MTCRHDGDRLCTSLRFDGVVDSYEGISQMKKSNDDDDDNMRIVRDYKRPDARYAGDLTSLELPGKFRLCRCTMYTMT